MSDILKSQPGASKPLNRVKQSPGIPTDGWKDKPEKHYAKILDRALNRDGDHRDEK
jgi:hypothetical protein